MKRLFDVCLCACVALTALPLLIAVATLVRLTSPGPALYWSRRVGRDNDLFWMPKFRTMRTDAPELATHLLTDSRRFITPLGRILRITSLDELPQLYSVLRGDMSLVGPRPALFNQHDLIEMRTAQNVHRVRPGLTGWAQINGRDELPIPLKVQFDAEYCQGHTSLWAFLWDLQIIAYTFVKVLRRDGYRQCDDQPATTTSPAYSPEHSPERRAA